jgi:hypothetical protein
MGYWLEGPSSIPGWGQFFLYSTASRPPLGFILSTMEWVPGVKRPKHEANHSSLSNAKFDNGGAVSPLLHTSLWYCV